MTNLVTGALRLPRRILHGGAAGDAGSAGATLMATNVVIQVGARFTTYAIGIVTVALTARTLKTAGYGVWSGVGSYTGLFGVLTDLGFSTVATRHMAAEPEREAEWVGALVGCASRCPPRLPAPVRSRSRSCCAAPATATRSPTS